MTNFCIYQLWQTFLCIFNVHLQNKSNSKQYVKGSYMVRYGSTVDGMWCYTYFNKRCWIIVGTSNFTSTELKMLSYVFCCNFNQDVFKNSFSGKNVNNIKNRGWQQSINCYVNSYILMLIMLFAWKSFTKPLNKLKCRTNIFWNISYSAIYLKCWLTKIY